jgi:hypothetical protein
MAPVPTTPVPPRFAVDQRNRAEVMTVVRVPAK